MFRRSRVSLAAALAVGGVAMLTTGVVMAQDGQRVEVTGSRIKRVDAETAAPVTIVTRDEIEKSGATNISDVIRSLAVDSNGSIPTAFGSGFAAGASAASLRGLGVNSTLVLLNGRRIAPYGLADDGQRNFSDLSSIPLGAVDRVEVLKDGASAIYGADAVGGVINVILRESFTGVLIDVSGGTTKYSDGNNGKASITAGFGNLASNRFNIVGSLEFSKQNAIKESDRFERGPQWRNDMSLAGYDYLGFNQFGILIDGIAISGGPAGAVRDASGGTNYRFLPCPAGAKQLSPSAIAQYPSLANNFSSQNGGPANCVFDAFDYYQVQPKEERLNGHLRGTLQLTPNLQGYAELSRFQTKVATTNTPSSVSSTWPDALNSTVISNAAITIADTHPDNPFAPDGAANRLRYHTADLGGRDAEYDTVALRALVGIKGTVGAWDIDTGALWSQSETERVQHGFLRNSVLRDFLNGTNVTGQNPTLTFYRLGANAGLNSAATRAAISPTLVNNLKTSISQYDLRGSTEVAQLPGGPMSVALGTEFRTERLDSPATPFTAQADIIGLGFSEFRGKRDVAAVFGELAMPFTKTVEASAALRFDRYSDFGNSTTPKVGLKWTPIRQLAIRGTYSEAFRAPGPAENGNSSSAGFTFVNDRVVSNFTGSTLDSNRQIVVVSVGNPNIRPETAKAYTIGFVIEPTESTNLSIDFWKVQRKDEINQPDPQQILDNPAAFPGSQIVRVDDGRGAVGPNGELGLAAVVGPYFNAASLKTHGVDIDLRHRMQLGSWGRMTAGLLFTHIESFKRTFPGGTEAEYAGSHGPTALSGNGGMPKDRLSASLGWDIGPWNVTGRVNYVGSMSNKENNNPGEPCFNTFADGVTDAPEGCQIKSFTTFDLYGAWSGIKNLTVYGSIRNLFDARSPYDPNVYSAFHYNPIYHLSGAIGRQFSIGAKYQF